jgi:hypothetical protein
VANPGAKKTGNGLDRGERKPAMPRWCPHGLSKMHQRCLQKLRQLEIAEKLREEERDWWFNKARPMAPPKQTWREKRLAREEDGTDNDDSSVGVDERKAEMVGGIATNSKLER